MICDIDADKFHQLNGPWERSDQLDGLIVIFHTGDAFF
jgi:hypothetical protein